MPLNTRRLRSAFEPVVTAAWVARERGPRELADRALLRTHAAVRRPSLGIELHPEDIIAELTPERTLPRASDHDLRVALVMTPPSERSGGHRTIMRLVERMESAGMHCTLYLYDFYSDRPARHEPAIRRLYPLVRAGIRDARMGLGESHAIVATSWETAQLVARSGATGKHFYLVQDFEPWFSARGTAHELAMQTYSLGFHGIAIGRWLPEYLATNFGMTCDSFPFACDVSRYSLDPDQDRRGIAFYSRPSTPRRAFGLGMLALSLVHRARPEIPIHLYGESTGWGLFPVNDHGTLQPAELNALYNQCRVGLALSMTNVSLVPWEMLAAGCIPIVNNMPEIRASLDNPYVRYAPATPEGLAQSLLAAYDDASPERASAAGSVASLSWAESGDEVVKVLRREVGSNER